MPVFRGQLFQNIPSSTDAMIVYIPAQSNFIFTKILRVEVCNVTASAATYRIHINDNGTSATTSNALAYDVALPANSTHSWATCWLMSNKTGRLLFRSGTANALNITGFGEEETSG